MKTSALARRIVAPALILLGLFTLAYSVVATEILKTDDYATCYNDAYPPDEPDREPLPQLTVVYHPLVIGAECDWQRADGSHYRASIRGYWGGYINVAVVVLGILAGSIWLVLGEISSWRSRVKTF